MRGVQGQGGDWGEGIPGDGGNAEPEVDDWGSHEWAAMTRAAAAAHEEAFWEVPPEPATHVMATTSAQHLQHRPTFKDALRDHPWHTVKGVATAKGTLVALAGVAAAVVFVLVAVAAFSGGDSSDDVTLNGNPGRGDDDLTRGFDGDKTRDGTTSTMADTTTAPSSSTTEATTTTTEDPDDSGDDGDNGDDPPVAPPPTTPDTEPPPPETTTPAPTTTTTTVAQPAIDRFDVDLDSWCSHSDGTVEATLRWTSRNGSSATLTSTTPGQEPVTVGLTEDDFDACPRPGDRWTLRVNGPPGTTPASRTVTIPALPNS